MLASSFSGSRPLRALRATLIAVAGAAALALPTAEAAEFPAGFTASAVRQRPVEPDTMAFAPDGRLFVSQQGGQLRVIKNGALLPTPFLTVTVNSPASAACSASPSTRTSRTNHFVYVYYTATTPAIHNRVSRFTANGDVAVAGQRGRRSSTSSNLERATNHNGGAMHFGPDGKLYVAVGENANGAERADAGQPARQDAAHQRRRHDPDRQPVLRHRHRATTARSGRWACATRSPSPSSPAPGRMFINDVGAGHVGGDQRRHRRRELRLAGDRGRRPPTRASAAPLYCLRPRRRHDRAAPSPAARSTTRPTAQFPAEYAGDYFFADYCGGWIRRLDPARRQRRPGFATGIDAPGRPAGDARTAASTTWRAAPARSSASQFDRRARRRRSPPQPADQTVAGRRSRPPSPWRPRARRRSLPVAAQRRQHRRAPPRATYTTRRPRTLADNGAQLPRRGHQRLRQRDQQRGDADRHRQQRARRRPSRRPPTARSTAAATRSPTPAPGPTPRTARCRRAPSPGRSTSTTTRTSHPFVPADQRRRRAASFTIPTRGETSANVWYRIHLTVTRLAAA